MYFRIPEGTSSYSILKNFSNGILAGPRDFNPQNPYSNVYLSKDFTADFQKTYPEIDRVDLTEEMYLYPYFHHLKIAKEFWIDSYGKNREAKLNCFPIITLAK